MSYLPPGIHSSSFEPGIHKVTLVEFGTITKADTLSRLGAKVAYKATFKSLDTAAEIDLLIKFNESKADFYAGQNIDRLFLAGGLPEPTPGEALDLTAMVMALNGKEVSIEVNDKGYANSVLLPQDAPTGEEAF